MFHTTSACNLSLYVALQLQVAGCPAWLVTGDKTNHPKLDRPGLVPMNTLTTALVQHMFPRLLAGGRQAQRIAQLCSAPLMLAGKGTPVGSSPAAVGGDQGGDALDQSVGASPSLALLHQPLPVPNLPTHPLGYLDPGARKSWMAGQPGLYKFTAEGYVGVVPKAVYRLTQHNAFAQCTGSVSLSSTRCLLGKQPNTAV
jgi:hypothetical protein